MALPEFSAHMIGVSMDAFMRALPDLSKVKIRRLENLPPARKENKMKDLEAELSRIEDLISAQHPCDARMYGLELCELVRNALDDIATEKVVTHFEAVEAAKQDKAMTYASGYVFTRESPEPNESVKRLKCAEDGTYWWRLADNSWWGTWGPKMSSSAPSGGGRKWASLFDGGRRNFVNATDEDVPEPGNDPRVFGRDSTRPDDVDHITDNDGDHWWRNPKTGRWATTNGTDYPPNLDEFDIDDTHTWEALMRQYPPFREEKPQAFYLVRTIFDKNNPPPDGVRAVVPVGDEDVVYYRPRNRDAWRSIEWDDDDIKLEGYSTWEELCRDFGNQFVKAEGSQATVPAGIRKPLVWEEDDEDDEPHESIIAVINMGTGDHWWRCTCKKVGWVKHGAYVPMSADVCKSHDHHDWERVMAEAGRPGVQELLAAKDK